MMISKHLPTFPPGDPRRSPGVAFLLAAVLSALLAGCGRTLMPVPDIYRSGEAVPFVDLAPQLQADVLSVPYVTDRRPAGDQAETADQAYGSERSRSVALGLARVRLPEDSLALDADATRTNRRIAVESVDERVRFPETPYPYDVDAQGRIRPLPTVAEASRRAEERAQALIRQRLALTPRKEVYVLVHGVGNRFEDAVLSAAEVWHVLGREGVVVAYTWPAGNPGLFFYTADRESGEFTILHLKQFLRVLAAMPEVERIHLMAHSRGTDVATTALRELVLELRGAGVDPRDGLKIDNVVLVAADLDLDVAFQRLVGEALGAAVGRVTVYVNANDQALAAATALFNSRQRVGALRKRKLTAAQREILTRSINLDILVFRKGRSGLFNHGYFRDPGVSSDIIALLRYRDRPGTGARQGLQRIAADVWRF